MAVDVSLQVHILPEGAAEPFSLLGLVRLIQHLAVSGTLDTSAQITFIVDSGTGTTAIGEILKSQFSFKSSPGLL